MKKSIKKAFSILSTIFFHSILVLTSIIVLAVIAYFIDQGIGKKNGLTRAPLFGAYIIITGSMEPNIMIDDAVVTMRRSKEDIKVNDVITFVSQNPNHNGVTITHRVVGIVKLDNGKVSYRTKGDHNSIPDSSLVEYDNILGKVLFKIPKIGYLQTIIKNYKLLVLIVIPCMLIIFSDIFKGLKRKLDEDENDNSDKTKMDDISTCDSNVNASINNFSDESQVI